MIQALLVGAALLAAAPAASETLGTTFPYVHLRRSGKDWRAALDAADDLGLKVLRVGAYWSEIEKTEGEYDFSELDELLDRAESKGYRLVVAVGMKAPVWPEYYIPAWALPKARGHNVEISKDAALRLRTLKFVGRTVAHLAGRSSIAAWQVENEPMDRAGEDRWFIGADFVELEARVVRRSDPARRPLIVNVWADTQLRSSAPWSEATYAARNGFRIADILGVDVYPRVDGSAFSWTRASTFPAAYRALTSLDRKPAWIIESQAEDWGKTKISPDDVRDLVSLHREQGYDVILLWGFQSWYEKKLAGDPALWNAVRELSYPGPRILAAR